jgi:hypothetical protein
MTIDGPHDGESCSQLLVYLFELGVLDGLNEEHSEEHDD